MKFKPDARKRNKTLSIYLYTEDIELLKTWGKQVDVLPAKLAAQIIEHQLRESKLEILQKENNVRRFK